MIGTMEKDKQGRVIRYTSLEGGLIIFNRVVRVGLSIRYSRKVLEGGEGMSHTDT